MSAPNFSALLPWEKLAVMSHLARRDVLIGIAGLLLMLVYIGLQVFILVANTVYNVNAQNNTQLYGLPNEQGVFVSIKERPTDNMIRYAGECLINFLSFDEQTIDLNQAKAELCFDPDNYANGYSPDDTQRYFLINQELATNDGISRQILAEELDYKEARDGRTAVARFEVTVADYVGRYLMAKPDKKTFRVVMNLIQPTTNRPLGLSIREISES